MSSLRRMLMALAGQKKEDLPYFYVEGIDDCEIYFTKTGTAPKLNLTYIKNGVEYTWEDETSPISVSAGEKVYVYGYNTCTASTTSRYNTLMSTGKFNVGGKLVTLLDKDATNKDGAVQHLFRHNKNLIDASELILYYSNAENTFRTLFYGCINLKAAPALIPNSEASNIYAHMFTSCNNLTDVYCYFKKWFTEVGCTTGIFNRVTSAGTFHVLKGTTWTDDIERGIDTIPVNWTIVKDL